MTARPFGIGRPWRQRAIPPRTRIWLCITVLAATTVVLLVTAVPAESPLDFPVTVPWVVLVAAFALTEMAVVHTQPDRETTSFSLTELVLVVGLFVADPVGLVAAQVFGAGLIFVFHLRQAPIKLAFNLTLYALTACLATATFAAVVGGGDAFGVRGWIAASAAILVATVATELAIFYAVGTAEGRFDARRLLHTMALTIPFTQGSAAIALVGVRTLTRDPLALLLLIVPALLILLSYRSTSHARRERLKMAFLHEVGTLLHRGGHLEPALVDLLDSSRAAFRAKVAEFTMLGPDGDVTTTSSVEGAEPSVLTCSPTSDHQQLMELIGDGSVVRTAANTKRGTSRIDRYARRRGFKNLMAVAVSGDRMHGVLLVGDRHGEVSTFDAADATLFATLAHQVGRVLDNGHLEQSLRQVTELKEQLTYRASHDSLTALANRGHFLEETQRAIDRARQQGAPHRGPTVLYIDLDGFKEVNDSLGHHSGDTLLQVVASRLRSCVRSGDLLARVGGDEFAVLLDGSADDAVASATATRIGARISDPVDLMGRLVMVGVSIGIASSSPDTPTVSDLVRCADIAMYSAKRAGGRQYAFYRPTRQVATRPRYSAAELTSAIERGQVVVHYQPIVDLRTGTIVGVEALVRWHHPTDGELQPDAFIPLAERSGLITALGNHVLRRACLDAREWLDHPRAANLFVAVNLSATQLADTGLLSQVTAAVQDAGISPSSLLLEITETTLMRDQTAAADTLTQLKDLGVQLAVDDFGTGYSSLAYLRRFPVDMLKIASEFTQGIDSTPDENVVTQAIIQLADTLGLRTVAEGIETSTQHNHLAELSCAFGQGYLFSHPVPSDQIHQLLAEHDPPAPRTAA